MTAISRTNLIDFNTDNRQTENVDNDTRINIKIKKRMSCFGKMFMMLFASSLFVLIHILLQKLSLIKNLNALIFMCFFSVCLPINACFVYFWKDGKGFRK